MAARRSGGSKAGGCLGVFVLAVFVLVAVAFGLGAIDHLRYSLSGARDYGYEAVDSGFDERLDYELRNPCYAYSQLDEEGKRCYRIMYDALRTREPRAYPESGQDSLSLIRACIVADHPELFYVEGVRMSTTYNQVTYLVSETIVEGTFYYDEAQTAAIQAQVNQAVFEFLATVPAYADDYTKAKLAYEYVIQHTSYDHSASELLDWNTEGAGRMPGQTMDAVFVDGTAVCAGYSAAYEYLLQQMGIVCVQVRGSADGVGHAWCVALLDGSFYNIDPTWGDPQFSEESNVGVDAYVNYDYLAVTDADIASTHVLDNAFATPTCVADFDNYYVREGLLFEEADVDALAAIVAEAERAGQLSVQVRCADDEVYHLMLDGFVASGDLGFSVSDYEYRYTCSDAMRTITIFP